MQLFEDLGTFRSDFKKVARQIAIKHWDWEPDVDCCPQPSTEYVLELYNDLTKETRYIHGEPDKKVRRHLQQNITLNKTRKQGNFDNFSSAALRELCAAGYYTGKSSLAASFPEVFSKHLPSGALAFASTAVSHELFLFYFSCTVND